MDQLSSKDYAKRLVTLSGSEEELFLSLQQAIEAKDMQWALQLSDSLLALNYKNDSTKKLRQEAIQFIGDRATNPNKRNYFLSSANELNDGYQAQPLLPQTSELLGEVSIDMFFDILSVKLNGEKTIGLTQRVCFSFDSGVIKTITLRNGIAEISSKNTNCDIQIRTSEQVFKEALAGVRNPFMSVASGEIDTDGQRTKFLTFLSNFTE